MMAHPAVWDEQRHSLGMSEIDHAHQEFIAQVASLIQSSDAEFPALFQMLINHTREHFTEEGRLMRACKYPGLGMHENEHHRVLGELLQLNRSLKRGRLPLVRAYVKHGLPEWFDTHLRMLDAALVAHINGCQGKISVAPRRSCVEIPGNGAMTDVHLPPMQTKTAETS